jgi:digeranylgeranylglycerophospholipid reductase
MKIGIVGGGINGSYLAWKLAKEHDVTVFEKKKSLGKEVCSGLVSERIWKFIPRSEKLVLNTIDEAVLHFPKKDVSLRFHPRMLVLNRKPLDRHVASLAEKSGAKLMLDSEVKKVYHVRGMKPQVLASGKVIEFDYLIGCDGFFSIVRKAIGIRTPKHRLGIYTYASKRNDSHSLDIYPTKDGFCWAIPRKRNVEYGILEKPDIARRMFNSFCKNKKLKTKKIYSYVVPGDLTDAYKGRVALCGDAIGLTKPWSGGGILWGLVADNILVKDFPNFGKYEYDIGRYFGPKIFFSNLAQRIGKYVGNEIPRLTPSSVSFDGDWVF